MMRSVIAEGWLRSKSRRGGSSAIRAIRRARSGPMESRSVGHFWKGGEQDEPSQRSANNLTIRSYFFIVFRLLFNDIKQNKLIINL